MDAGRSRELNRLRSALRSVTYTLANFAQVGARQIMLAPIYLEHLLWLLTGKFRDLVEEGYGKNPAVYACMRLLSTSVPEPPLKAYLRDPEGEPGVQLGYAHPIHELIRRPNPLMTEYEMWELATLQLCVTGQSFWWKERDNSGRIKALWPMRPDRVGPIYAGEGDAEKVLAGWSYQIPGTGHYIPIPRSEIISFNLPNPMGESGGIIEGLGPLQVLSGEVGADNEATRFVGDMIANYAQPGVVISVKKSIAKLEDAQFIKQGFQREFGGARRGVPAVIDSDSTLTQLGFNLQQLEFPALRRISESRIAATFGVPAILVGLLVGLESGIRATIEEQRAYFAETTLTNYWRRFSDQFTNDVAVEFGVGLVCKFDTTVVRALVGQATEQLETIAAAYAAGAVTRNEYRVALGLPLREDGDDYATGIGPGTGIPVMVSASPNAPDMDTSVAEEAQATNAPIAATKSKRSTPEDDADVADVAAGTALLKSALSEIMEGSFNGVDSH